MGVHCGHGALARPAVILGRYSHPRDPFSSLLRHALDCAHPLSEGVFRRRSADGAGAAPARAGKRNPRSRGVPGPRPTGTTARARGARCTARASARVRKRGPGPVEGYPFPTARTPRWSAGRRGASAGAPPTTNGAPAGAPSPRTSRGPADDSGANAPRERSLSSRASRAYAARPGIQDDLGRDSSSCSWIRLSLRSAGMTGR
jgi:hypothetical protein